MKTSKIEIRQCNGEQGVFTELLIDGHKINGLRSFELKQLPGNSVPTLTIDLNVFDLTTDVSILKLRQSGMGEVESIKFKGCEKSVEFGKLEKGEE